MQIYRALGGGWEIRCPAPPGVPPNPYEARQELPLPLAVAADEGARDDPAPPPTVPPVIAARSDNSAR